MFTPAPLVLLGVTGHLGVDSIVAIGAGYRRDEEERDHVLRRSPAPPSDPPFELSKTETICKIN